VDQETRTTTSSGAFTFSDIDPGDYDVRVDVPATFELDGQANPIQVDVQAGQTENISFVLQLLAGTVSGTVSTGGGAGVRGMTVGLRSRGGSTDQRSATTNAAGDFTFTRVPVGEWDIFLRGDAQTANPVETSVDEGQTVAADFTASITVEFASDIQPVFTGNCALSGCHAGANPNPPEKPMSLEMGNAYDNIVNVSAGQLPSMDRVEPGQPDDSYLVHKIQGTQGTVGGSGVQMPATGGPLPDATIDMIRQWVTEGAANN
jgi:hypothetical protein